MGRQERVHSYCFTTWYDNSLLSCVSMANDFTFWTYHMQDSRRSQTPAESIDGDTQNDWYLTLKIYISENVIISCIILLCSCSDHREQLHRAEDELCLLRGILQGLIAGSGVPWGQDTKLLELTVKLGDDQQWK